jgi:hypothetical protein
MVGVLLDAFDSLDEREQDECPPPIEIDREMAEPERVTHEFRSLRNQDT